MIRLLSMGLAGILAIQQLNQGIYLFELTGALLIVQLGLAICFFALSTVLKDWVVALVSVLAIALSAPQILYATMGPTIDIREGHIRIVQANVFHHNPNLDIALAALLEEEADLISIQELNSEWAPAILKALKSTYPYFHEEYQDSCCYGIGLYSKYPFLYSRSILLEGVLVIEARMKLKHGELTVFSQHTLPPVFPNNTRERNRQLQELSRLVRTTNCCIIALGDFNVVPWDNVMKDFLTSSGQTRLNSGFQATYPMEMGIPLIPIDYITYSDGLFPTQCETVKIPGSDHRGIVASFRFKE